MEVVSDCMSQQWGTWAGDAALVLGASNRSNVWRSIEVRPPRLGRGQF